MIFRDFLLLERERTRNRNDKSDRAIIEFDPLGFQLALARKRRRGGMEPSSGSKSPSDEKCPPEGDEPRCAILFTF